MRRIASAPRPGGSAVAPLWGAGTHLRMTEANFDNSFDDDAPDLDVDIKAVGMFNDCPVEASVVASGHLPVF